MHGLLWYEYLYQSPLPERQHAEVVVWNWFVNTKWEEKAREMDANGVQHPPYVYMARWLNSELLGQFDTQYPRLMRTVEMVILPNAVMALTLSRERANEILSSQSAGTKFDPWVRRSEV
ncbi:MAG: hypothetical protein U9Q81_10305 [Pseudomonadota bacterium]|nr:hypothetical protein [Pseudomonadota bacterium]